MSEGSAPSTASKFWKEMRDWLVTILWIAPICLVFNSVAFASYNIPSESMVPTLEVGDRIFVSKYAYGYSRDSLPFDLGRMLPESKTRLFAQLPKRGDVVVFRNPFKAETMIKRLVGLPGDTIEVRGGHLFVNEQPVALKNIAMIERLAFQKGPERALQRQETLPGGARHLIDEFSDVGPADTFAPYKVPPGMFFAMGDNRDNSADSRFSSMGPVPLTNLVGRAEIVWFVTKICDKSQPFDCAKPRLFKSLAPQWVQPPG